MSLALAWGLALGPVLAQDAKRPPNDDPAWKLCSETAAQVEAKLGLPKHLLGAVSLAETGRAGPNRQISAWPWTVHDGARGYYFATREEAVDFVRNTRFDGQRSIDVGCMQVNLRHHPRAFTSVSMGFDPKANIEYAAGFLVDLALKSGSWEEAIAKYHTQNPGVDEDYAPKVLAFLARERARSASPGSVSPKLVRAGSLRGSQVVKVASAQPAPLRFVIASAAEAAPAAPSVPAVMGPAVPSNETGAFALRRSFSSAR
jgi:hypothetical protein